MSTLHLFLEKRRFLSLINQFFSYVRLDVAAELNIEENRVQIRLRAVNWHERLHRMIMGGFNSAPGDYLQKIAKSAKKKFLMIG